METKRKPSPGLTLVNYTALAIVPPITIVIAWFFIVAKYHVTGSTGDKFYESIVWLIGLIIVYESILCILFTRRDHKAPTVDAAIANHLRAAELSPAEVAAFTDEYEREVDVFNGEYEREVAAFNDEYTRYTTRKREGK